MPQTEKASSVPAPWGIIPPSFPPFLREVPIILAVLAAFYGLLTFSRYGIGPVNTQAEIRLDPTALPKYAAFSLIRIAIAYFLSLLFTFVYGYIAAYNSKAERFMIPLLDTLQSIPVLSFLPAVMVSMVALFPNRQLGVELGSIILIVTGQVWNMTFSFYSSLKSIPNEMREAAEIYRLSWWQRFTEMELPFATIGLIWNSMMSVAGAWFFLMACEMFVLGNRDLRLPGLGSYLQTAANAGDTRAIIWGLAAMVTVIVLVDQVVWRPAIAWAEKFKFEQVEAAFPPRSPVLDLLRRSKILSLADRVFVQPMREALNLRFARAHSSPSQHHLRRRLGKLGLWMVLVGGLLGVAYALGKMTNVNELNKVTFKPNSVTLSGHESAEHRAFRCNPGEVVGDGRGGSRGLARPKGRGAGLVVGRLSSDLFVSALRFESHEFDPLGPPGEPGGGGRGTGAAPLRSPHRLDGPVAPAVGAALGAKSRAARTPAGGLGRADFGGSSAATLWGGVNRPPSTEVVASPGLSAEARQLRLPAGTSPRCGTLPAALKKNSTSGRSGTWWCLRTRRVLPNTPASAGYGRDGVNLSASPPPATIDAA